MKKILIIGSGGREHALGWKLSQSDEVSNVFYAPGNGGTAENKGINIPIEATKKENFEKIYEFIGNEKIDMTIVGPEGPLNDGIVDYLNAKGYYRVFGPSQKASLLESDKFFSFDLMTKLDIPQARSIKCYNLAQTVIAINNLSSPEGIVVKARGLTGGKGVHVYDSKNDAINELISNHDKICDSTLTKNHEVLIAERLFGEEFSVFGISDGTNVYPFEIAFQDHKRLLEGDKGPNTGGMGAYGPIPNISKELIKRICNTIMTPVVRELTSMGIVYIGFIYAGMIMTKNGPKVLEFNVRFGDPECQPAMMMLKSDLYDLLDGALAGVIKPIIFNLGVSCCVVLVSKSYPSDYKKGMHIYGLENAERIENVKIFHAGTRKDGNKLITDGGRILGITGYSPIGLEEARKNAYEAVSKINIENGFEYRKDIGYKALITS